MEAGTKVVCTYRMPTTHQPWIQPVHIGTIETPSTDPKDWNGRNSEAEYCERCRIAKVRYSFGVMYDNIDSLQPLTDEQFIAELETRSMSSWTDEELHRYSVLTGQEE